MKRHITISVEKSRLWRECALAAQRGASISAIVARELLKTADRESSYELAQRKAMARRAFSSGRSEASLAGGAA
jgi:hypothetical protein